jgi:hypothetical protein
VARISRGAARQNNHNFGSKSHSLIISNNSASTHPHPCLASRQSIVASLPSDVFRYFLLFTSLRPSLDLICRSSMNRPISRTAASCLNIPASGRRAVAFLFHLWRCYSTFRRSVARSPLPPFLFRPASSGSLSFHVSCAILPVGHCPDVFRSFVFINFPPYCLSTSSFTLSYSTDIKLWKPLASLLMLGVV